MDISASRSKEKGRTMRTSEQGSPVKFPFKLYEMLQTAEEEIISFQPHGRSFMIRDMKRFKKEVLPRHFYQRRMAFFVSQLSSYGFVQITSGRDEGAYYHELFVRGEPGLLHFLRKVKVKGACKDTEPDFYKIEVRPPSPCRSGSCTPPLEEEDTAPVPNEAPSASVATGDENDLELPQGEELVNLDITRNTSEENGSNEQSDGMEAELVLPGEEELVSLGSSAAPLPTDIIKQIQEELSTPTHTPTCGPLVIPGRLRAQPLSKPTAIRFVPMPDQTEIQQAEAFRWTAPLQLKPISTQLEVRSEIRSSTPANSTPTEGLPPMPVTPLSSPVNDEGQKCETLYLGADDVFPSLPLSSEPADDFMKMFDSNTADMVPLQPISLDDDMLCLLE